MDSHFITRLFLKIFTRIKTKIKYPLQMIHHGNTIQTQPRNPKTLIELKMIQISQDIRSKHNWSEKLNNQNIIEKWKLEMRAFKLRDRDIKYIIDELKYYASMKDEVIEFGLVDGTWQSDKLIDEITRTNFIKAIYESLENIDEKDYHPGSDNLVVDLVHPSLFCFVCGVSKFINEEGIDEDILKEIKRRKRNSIISKYRWLPAEVTVNEHGNVSFESYINNLPPKKNKSLYFLIENILSSIIPMFSRVLHDINYPRGDRIEVNDSHWYDEFFYDEDLEESEDTQYEKWEKTRKTIQPKAGKFVPSVARYEQFDLKNEKLQIIVKLANIELTPENPKYNGGVWHVEGTSSEFIVATGIYYYDMENITESRLMFRQAINEPDYEQYDERGVFEVYGLKDSDILVQEIGSVIAKEGRCIAFPNTYQHKVAPFELADKTKKGHRKILVFFLIDPSMRIVSTKNIAPQNPVWDDENNVTGRNTMTLEEAKKYRLDLMSERKYVRNEYSEELFEREFSLCEH